MELQTEGVHYCRYICKRIFCVAGGAACVCMTQVLYALHLLLAKNTLSQKKVIHFHVFVQLSPQIVTLSLRENIAMDLAHVSVLTVSTN